MREVFIYTLSDPKTNIIKYVGKTVTPRRRFNDHKNIVKINNKKDRWIKALLKNGKSPVMDIIDVVNESDWQFWEMYWISQIKSWGFELTNSTDGGDGSTSTSKETREKLRKAHIGKKQPLEAIAKTAAANRGRKNTEECKRIISEKLKGRKIPEDVLLKRAKSQSKPILQYDLNGIFIKEYPSIKAAKMSFNPTNNGLSGVLKGQVGYKTWKGFKWKYKE